MTTVARAEMAAASINDLPDSAFAYIEPGGKKDASGRTEPRSLRHFPVHDADHARNALSRAPQSPFGDKAMPAIRKAARKFGIDVADDSGSGGKGMASRAEYLRVYPVEDMHIIRSADGGDGRTVEAFCAVFDEETEIEDQHGHYREVVDRAAFNRTLDHVGRKRGGLSNIKVMYNHGRTIDNTPSDRFSIPIGTPVDIRAEPRGLLTRTRYSKIPLADEVLRSDPQLGRGRRHYPSRGQLPLVRRMELGLRDYGPVVFPAYSGAEILGVRMSAPGSWNPGPDDHEQNEENEENDPGTPPDEGPAPGDPLSLEGDEHSARYHQHALYRLRSQEMREELGLVW